MDKKALIPNILIGFGILVAALLLSASLFAQKAAVKDRTLGQDQAAVRMLGIEGQGALTYLDSAAILAAVKAKKDFEASGGLETDYEGGGYPCGSILGRAYWYNDGQECIPPFEEALTNFFREALTGHLNDHPYLSYPGFTYTLTPRKDHKTDIEGTGVRSLLFGTSFKGKDFSYFQKTSFTPDYPEAITPVELKYGSRGGKEPEKIVVHYTVTKDAYDAISVLESRGLSYHYIIGHDGKVYQLAPESGSAWHAGCSVAEEGNKCLLPGMNQRSIGISFVNCGNDKKCQSLRPSSTCETTQGSKESCSVSKGGAYYEDYDQAQIEAFVKLVADIVRRNPQLAPSGSVSKETFLMHSDITTTKYDPGPLFTKEFDDIIKRINQELRTTQVAQRSDITKVSAITPPKSPEEQAQETASQFAAPQGTTSQKQSLIGPSAWCTGQEAPASSSYAQRIEVEAFNSNGQTYLQASIAAGLEYDVDPALLITHMIHESSMGQNNACTAKGKSALTGCGWPTSCSKDCGCTGENVQSDKEQLRCTARTDLAAYQEAMSGAGNAAGQYEKCNQYAADPDKMWTCMLCIYQGNYAKDVTGTGAPYFTKDGTCDYAERFKETYCSWNAYLAASGAIENYDVSGGIGGQRESATYSLPVSFKATMDVDLDRYRRIGEFVKGVIEKCPDNDPQACLQEAIQEHNTLNSDLKLSTDCDDNEYLAGFLKQYASCEQRPAGVPCSIEAATMTQDPFFLRINLTGMWEITKKDEEDPLSREAYPGYDHDRIAYQQQEPEERNITILFHHQNDHPYADIYLNSNLDPLQKDIDLEQHPLVFTNDEKNRTYLDMDAEQAMPAANTSFTICEEEKGKEGFVFALDLEDPLPPPVKGLAVNYHDELEAYELRWEPATSYEEGGAVNDIMSYEVYCSWGAIEEGSLLDEKDLTATITRKDKGPFPPKAYEEQGSMSVLVDQCAGRPIGGGKVWFAVIAKDSSGQYSVEYENQGVSPLSIGRMGFDTIDPSATTGLQSEEVVEPSLSTQGLPSGLLPEQANALLPLLKRYYFPASSTSDILAMLTRQ